MLLTCRVGVYASLSAPSVWLYLCLPTPLASPPPPPPPVLSLPRHQLTPSIVPRLKNLPARWQTTRGLPTPQQLVALFTCAARICARLPARLQCTRSRRLRASAGTGGINQTDTLICIRWLKRCLGHSVALICAENS